MKKVKNKELEYLAFRQREEEFIHHTYEEERFIYELMEAGNNMAVNLMQDKFISNHNGILSHHPIKNMQYHFVVDCTLVARACISGGLSYLVSYSLSDLYVQKADLCTTIEEIKELHLEIFHDADVDLVLSGHDHIYSRSYYMDGITPDTNTVSNRKDAGETLYITGGSSSGNKFYGEQEDKLSYSAFEYTENDACITHVEVGKNRITVTAYTIADGREIDRYTLVKE